MAISNIVCRAGVGPQSAIKYLVTHGLAGNAQPVFSAIILGLSMIAAGLTILEGLSPRLYKGLVMDELNKITR